MEKCFGIPSTHEQCCQKVVIFAGNSANHCLKKITLKEELSGILFNEFTLFMQKINVDMMNMEKKSLKALKSVSVARNTIVLV